MNKIIIKSRARILENILFTFNYILMILLCISLLMPMIWLLYSSLKGYIEYSMNIFGLPEKLHFENFEDVFKLLIVKVMTSSGQKTYGLFSMFLNSIIYASGTSFMAVLVPALTAYIVSKYNFKGKNFIYSVAIITMILPIIGSLASTLKLYKALGIYDNILMYILISAGPFGFNFLLLYGAFKSISWSYAEAAFIDGAGHLKVMYKVMFPMMLPTFATLFILSFINAWNTYVPLLLYLPNFPNLFLGMYKFQIEAAINYATPPQILAGLIVVAIPSILLYVASQKLLMSKFMVGGLKG